MSDRWEVMKRLKRVSFPGQMIFVGIETENIANESMAGVGPRRLKSWHVISWRIRKGQVWTRKEHHGEWPEEFWDHVIATVDAKQSTWLWCHQASVTMSLLGLDEVLQSGDIATKIEYGGTGVNGDFIPASVWEGLTVLSPSVTIIQCRETSDNCPLTILDTRNFFRLDEWDLCDRFDRSQIEYRGKCIVPNPKWPSDRYFCHIVEAAIHSVVSMVREHKLGRLCFTAASQSLAALRHNRLKVSLTVHRVPEVVRLEREGYKGGMCRVFRQGVVSGPIHVVDIASCYISIMQRFCLPYKMLDGCTIDPLHVINSGQNQLWCIAECEFTDTDQDHLVNVQGRPTWARGNLRCVMHTPDIKELMNRGIKIRVLRRSIYQSCKWLALYADSMWNMRQQYAKAGDRAMEFVAKTIANSLCGKLGSRVVKSEECPGTVPIAPTCRWTEYDLSAKTAWEYTSLAWRVQRREMFRMDRDNTLMLDPLVHGKDTRDLQETWYSCPFVAGAITAIGRRIMAGLIHICGKENVHYCDTDCVHVNDAGFVKLCGLVNEVAAFPGALRDEGTFKEAEYRGQRHYRLDDEWTIAGVKKTATELGNNVYAQVCCPQWSTVLERGMPQSVSDEIAEVDTNGLARDGIVTKDGRTDPVYLKMWR